MNLKKIEINGIIWMSIVTLLSCGLILFLDSKGQYTLNFSGMTNIILYILTMAFLTVMYKKEDYKTVTLIYVGFLLLADFVPVLKQLIGIIDITSSISMTNVLSIMYYVVDLLLLSILGLLTVKYILLKANSKNSMPSIKVLMLQYTTIILANVLVILAITVINHQISQVSVGFNVFIFIGYFLALFFKTLKYLIVVLLIKNTKEAHYFNISYRVVIFIIFFVSFLFKFISDFNSLNVVLLLSALVPIIVNVYNLVLGFMISIRKIIE